MSKLDVKLNLLQAKFYYLFGKLLEKVRKLPLEEGNEMLAILQLMEEELDKFLDSFREKEKGGEK